MNRLRKILSGNVEIITSSNKDKEQIKKILEKNKNYEVGREKEKQAANDIRKYKHRI